MKFPWNTSNGYQVIERTQNSITKDQRETTPKISKTELRFLCMTHCLIVLQKCMKFQSNSFNSVQLTERTKIAISYVTRGIIWRINMQELWFCAWHVVWMCFTNIWRFVEISPTNGYQVIEGTRNSIANDQREITPKHPKQSYRSCTWRIVSLCSRSVWSFNQIV